VERIVGLRPVTEALRARRRKLERLYLRGTTEAPRSALRVLLEMARIAGLPAAELAPCEFDTLVPRGVNHQGVLLEAGPLPIGSLQDLGDTLTRARWLLALDGIEDPQNLGAIVRVAVAAGVDAAILPRRRRAALGPGVNRASAGALEHLPLILVSNLATALDRTKQVGFWVHAADPAGSEDLFDTTTDAFEERRILVLGGEHRGIRPGLRRHIDRVFRIPMDPRIDSLNVAAAAAVMLFEWRRRDTFTRGEGGVDSPVV